MVSWRKSNTKRRGDGSYRYEHITYEDNKKYENKEKNLSQWDGWLQLYKNDMDVMANRADKKAARKSKQREKNKLDYKKKDKSVKNYDEFEKELEDLFG